MNSAKFKSLDCALKRCMLKCAIAFIASGIAPVVCEAQTMLDEVRLGVQQLHQQGYTSSPIEVVAHSDDRYNGSAAWRLREGECKVEVRHEPIPSMSRYKGHVLWQRFIALHELAHCQLFAEPSDYGARGLGLDANGANLLSDLMALDGLAPRTDEYEESRTPLLSWYHEAYADAMAILQLRLENPTGAGLDFILTLRSGFTMSPSHETDHEIEALMAMPVNQIPLGLEGRKEMARRVALLETVRHVMGPSLKSNDPTGLSMLLGERLRDGLKSALKAKSEGKLAFSPFFIGDINDPQIKLEHLPVLQWIAKNGSWVNPDDGVSAWVMGRYGVDQHGLLRISSIASKHLEEMALSNGPRIMALALPHLDSAGLAY